MRRLLPGLALAAIACGGCATGSGPDRGWDAVARIPPGPYVVQTWEPIGGRTTPIFVIVASRAGEQPVRIIEQYGVTTVGEVADIGAVAAGYRQRYPALLPSEIEVERLAPGPATIGYVIRTRGIDVYAYHDRASDDYSVRLSGLGKYPKRGGGGPGGAAGGGGR